MKKLVISIITVLVLAYLSTSVVLYTDYAYICQTTGSRKGHTTWLMFDVEANDWHKPTALETYLKEHHPKLLNYDWVSYAGTGKNIIGKSLSFAHGRPSDILQFPPDYMEWIVKNQNDEKILQMLETFKSKDPNKIQILSDITRKLIRASDYN